MKSGRPREFDRAQALETAMQLFWEKGYEGTSKRDLMAATGIASQSLYNSFGDKRELFMEAIRHYADTRFGVIIEKLQQPGSPLENVRSIVRLWGNVPAEFEKGCFCSNSIAELGQSDEELAAFLGDQLTGMQSVFEQALERARAGGEINPQADTAAIAAGLVCSSNGVALMWRCGAPKRMIAEAVRGILLMLDAQ